MEHARKLLLVPANQAQNFEHLSDLDQQMQHILKEKLPDTEKAKLYLQILQKFVTFPNLKPSEEAPSVEPELLASAPVKLKSTAQKILDFFKNHSHVISWTPAKELVLKGKTLPQTNIVMLLNYLLRQRKMEPAGYSELKEILTELNFPIELVKNKHLLSPVRKPSYATRKNVWIKY